MQKSCAKMHSNSHMISAKMRSTFALRRTLKIPSFSHIISANGVLFSHLHYNGPHIPFFLVVAVVHLAAVFLFIVRVITPTKLIMCNFHTHRNDFFHPSLPFPFFFPPRLPLLFLHATIPLRPATISSLSSPPPPISSTSPNRNKNKKPRKQKKQRNQKQRRKKNIAEKRKDQPGAPPCSTA